MPQKININILCIKFKIIYNNVANPVVCQGWISPTHGKHLHDPMGNTCMITWETLA